jgi:hypothetical protein
MTTDRQRPQHGSGAQHRGTRPSRPRQPETGYGKEYPVSIFFSIFLILPKYYKKEEMTGAAKRGAV